MNKQSPASPLDDGRGRSLGSAALLTERCDRDDPGYGMTPGYGAQLARLHRCCAVPLVVLIAWPTAASAQTAALVTPAPLASPASAKPVSTAAPSASPGSANTQTVLVPGGTTVVVALTEPISSATANVNDQVAIVVKKEVDVSGWLIISAGANGHATVTSVEHAASNGSGGKLAMSVDWVYDVAGNKVQLSETNHASESGDTKGAASTATLLSWIFLGPLGFFAHNFVRGRDVSIGTDKTFTVFVDHDVHVQATQRAGQGQGFEH